MGSVVEVEFTNLIRPNFKFCSYSFSKQVVFNIQGLSCGAVVRACIGLVHGVAFQILYIGKVLKLRLGAKEVESFSES